MKNVVDWRDAPVWIDERRMEILLRGVQRDGIPVLIVKEMDQAAVESREKGED